MQSSENKSAREDAFPLWVATALLVVLGAFFNVKVHVIRFQYDDISLILTNPFIREAHGLREYLSAGRPMRTISLFLDYAMWGYNPRWYHLTNLTLHILCGLVLFRMLEDRFADRWTAWWTALIFLTHPVVSETLAVVSHRKESLAFLFMSLSLWSYLKASCPEEVEKNAQWNRIRKFTYALSLVFYLLGLGSKQVVIIFPVLAFVADTFISGRDAREVLKQRGLWYLPYPVIPALFMLTSVGDWRVFGYMPVGEMFGAFHWRVLAISGWSVTAYLRMLAWPILLSADHQFQTPSIWSALGGAFLWFGMVVMGWRLRKWNRGAAFGLIWIPLNLLMVLNLIPANQPLAERYLYIPLAGFCLFFVVLTAEAGKRDSILWTFFRWGGAAAISIIVLKYSLRYLFRNDLVLSGSTILIWVASTLLLGATLTMAAKRYSGKASFWQVTLFCAVAITAIVWLITPLMARLDQDKWTIPSIFISDRYDRFIYKYYHYKYGTSVKNFSGPIIIAGEICVTLFSCWLFGMVSSVLVRCPWTGNNRSRRNMAVVLSLVTLLFAGLNSQRLREWATQASIWEATLRTDPSSQRAYVNMGVYWVKHKRPERAEWYYGRAATINPLNSTVWYDLALLYLRENDYAVAEYALLKVVALDPGNDSAYLNLGNIYLVTGREPKAVEEYKKVIEINPRNARAYYNIAVLMEKNGDLKAAYDQCRKALELRSDFAKAAEMCGPAGKLKNPQP